MAGKWATNSHSCPPPQGLCCILTALLTERGDECGWRRCENTRLALIPPHCGSGTPGSAQQPLQILFWLRERSSRQCCPPWWDFWGFLPVQALVRSVNFSFFSSPWGLPVLSEAGPGLPSQLRFSHYTSRSTPAHVSQPHSPVAGDMCCVLQLKPFT